MTNYVGTTTSPNGESENGSQMRGRLPERMYEVTTDPQTGFEEKITGLLEAGCGSGLRKGTEPHRHGRRELPETR
ncbi:hypothetical protein C8039_19430 [Halogeometricum sp. wsp3]|nr:hypothetical protein C8039_19430 [Halogeometricum sp. wsp3]